MTIGKHHDYPLRAREEIARIKLEFLIEEITDLEGREGINDHDFAEQVIALAQRTREELADADAISSTTGQEWRDISSAPKDGSEILLLTTVGITQARFGAGEWHDHPEGREYEGPIWVCCDDQWQIEIEDAGEHGMHHGIATHWMPLPAPPVAGPIVAEKQTEAK